jgi:hypothetical protein
MERIYSGCPVIRSEVITLRVPQEGGGSRAEQHHVMWLRQAMAEVELRGLRRGVGTTKSSMATDRKALFESVDAAVSTASDTAGRYAVYLERINRGDYEMVVTATVRDVPVLADDRTRRVWTSMDALLPSYEGVPADWRIAATSARSRGTPLTPVEVFARSVVWSSAASKDWNKAVMSHLRLMMPTGSLQAMEAMEAESTPSPAMGC